MCKQVALGMVFMAFMINSTKSVNDNLDDSHLYIRSLIEIWLQKPNLIPNRLSGAINIIDKSKTLHNIFAPDVLCGIPLQKFRCPQCITIDVTNQLHAMRWKDSKSVRSTKKTVLYTKTCSFSESNILLCKRSPNFST